MDMVERVARAMMREAESWPTTSSDRASFAWFVRSHRMGLARAAIEAMREPTEAMIASGGREAICGIADAEPGNFIAADVWQAMISAALKESE